MVGDCPNFAESAEQGTDRRLVGTVPFSEAILLDALELQCRSLHCLIELRAEFRRRNEQIVGVFEVRQNLVED